MLWTSSTASTHHCGPYSALSREKPQRATLPSSVLHALGEHAAVLRVQVSGVVSDGRRVVGQAVGRGRAHAVTVWRRRPPKERPETTAAL